jgi:hypothetical protein
MPPSKAAAGEAFLFPSSTAAGSANSFLVQFYSIDVINLNSAGMSNFARVAA